MAKRKKTEERDCISCKSNQNNAILIHYITAKIDNTQQNNECSLCNAREETIALYVTVEN